MGVWVGIVVCFAAAAAYVRADIRSLATARTFFKLTASTAFLFTAVQCGAAASVYGRLIFLGLVFGWIGDAFLLSHRKGPFLIGIAAFLLGHGAYAAAFAVRVLDIAALAFSAALMAVFTAAIIAWLRPHLKGVFTLAVPAYIAVICVMTVLAFAQWAGGGPGLAAIGAAAFTASDVSVARERFVRRSPLNQAWGLPLYYLAQVLLALSVR